MRSSNGRLAFGTNGNPQATLLQETYAMMIAQNEARLMEELGSEPDPEKAKIDAEGKLAGYALNPDHPTGRDKARVFKSALGFTQKDSPNLKEQILEQVKVCEWKKAGETKYGKKYTVDVQIVGNNGKTATVRTGWIIDDGGTAPRLTSAYVLPKKGGDNA